MLYYLHEIQRLSMAPARAAAQSLKFSLQNPFNPASHSTVGKVVGSAADVFEHWTRRYGKPDFDIDQTEINGEPVAVTEEVPIKRTWCHLRHFVRATGRDDPKLLIVAPMSGHYATLLRGTVEAMLPTCDVYITDWQDARKVPVTEDKFNFFDYVDYIIDFLHYLGPNTHVMAVCQPSVPVMAAVSIMAGWGDTTAPATMTLIGGPIDTREAPTAVNKLAKEHDLKWFEQQVITTVPPPYPGMMRRVYPGFLQLTNFISMNLDRHMEAMGELFDHLVTGDEDAAEKKRAFYEEFLAVMDLPAEFYLQTIKLVFQDHALPEGQMVVRWHPAIPEKITRTAILCIEGELDDISGVGQTKAALEITPKLSSSRKHYHLQKGAGHYGVFNGSKFRAEIVPMINEFIREHDSSRKPAMVAMPSMRRRVGSFAGRLFGG